MSLRLESWQEEDGPLTEKRLMGLLEREGFEVAVYAYREGTVFEEHAHGQDKCDAVLEGFFLVRAGDAVFHTYSTYARGSEQVDGAAYTHLDITALGRQEDWEEPKGRAPDARPAGPVFS